MEPSLTAWLANTCNAVSDHPEHSPDPTLQNIAVSPGLAPLFQRTDWLSFGVTTALVLGGYSLTLAPDVTLDFSGIFSVGAMYAGVPHPPGYPLWTLYAWLFTVVLLFGCKEEARPVE